MTYAIVPQIQKEIETALDNYPYHPYRRAFASPELRCQLVTYVLRYIPMIAFENLGSSNIPEAAIADFSLRQTIKSTVREGINNLMIKNADWITHHIPCLSQPDGAPSSWFG